ncbi:MAG: hypothetical protein M3Y32_11125, partial [Pseudomonadota bacterium]|nr:hypothetical protein [Pseudomonadota bacterium]
MAWRKRDRSGMRGRRDVVGDERQADQRSGQGRRSAHQGQHLSRRALHGLAQRPGRRTRQVFQVQLRDWHQLIQGATVSRRSPLSSIDSQKAGPSARWPSGVRFIDRAPLLGWLYALPMFKIVTPAPGHETLPMISEMLAATHCFCNTQRRRIPTRFRQFPLTTRSCATRSTTTTHSPDAGIFQHWVKMASASTQGLAERLSAGFAKLQPALGDGQADA